MNLVYLTNIYAIITLLTCSFLVFLWQKIKNSNIENSIYIFLPIWTGIASTISYALFLFSENYLAALIFNTLYFIGTDWLALFMLMFSLVYTSTNIKKDFSLLLFMILAIVDTVSLIINIYTFHSFDIVQLFTQAGYSYWGLQFTPLHYVHLGFCYVMVGRTLLHLVYHSFRAPAFYKIKYVTVLAAYNIVIIANYCSYTLNTPIDFSVILYAMLAYFISHYSTYTFPAYLVNKTLHSVNETTDDVILYFDYRGILVYHNHASLKIFNKSKTTISDFAEQFRVLFLEDKPDEMTLELNDGTTHFFKTEYKDFFIRDSIVGSYLKLEDKTDEITTSMKRRHTATHDPLTGLLNREGFFEECQKALETGVFKSPILLCSNIKDFRLINELFGESQGDLVLKNQADLMKKAAHRKNLNGRLADDKFAILMEKKDFHREIFEEAFHTLSSLTENGIYQMSISVGIYEIFNKKESIQVIYDKAKMAMDSVHDDYQTMFAWYDSSMMDKLLAEKNIVGEFERALEDLQFDIYLQPTIDSDGTVTGAECLARWKHPHREVMVPSTFINILEQTGLVHKLDLYIWNLAAKKLKDWQNKGITNKFISVNISAKDFHYIDVAQSLIDIINTYNIDASYFCVEIPEIALIDSTAKTLEMFNKLKSTGVKIFIDRFGSDYSSLNMLKDFEADGIKLSTNSLYFDKFDLKQKTILQTIISMATDLNMLVICQGVEQKTSLQILKDLNCRLFQGYYYSKPMPVKEFESLYLAAELRRQMVPAK